MRHMRKNQIKKDNLILVKRVINQLDEQCHRHNYEFLLEADISGWIFHLFLLQPEIVKNNIHIDTRIPNSDRRFDIVIGTINKNAVERPFVLPDIAIEIKVFPKGFTYGQHRVHYEQILCDDLLKLNTITSPHILLIELILDSDRFLDGKYHGENKIIHIVNVRNRVSPRTHLFFVRILPETWQVIHKPPIKM